MTTTFNKKTVIGLAAVAAGAAGAGVYALRRQLIARWLNFSKPEFKVTVERNIRVLMPDGIALATDHYQPSTNNHAGIKYPTILIRTPYSKGKIEGLVHVFVCHRFAERGYHVISQDTRGCFESEGEFEPFVNEARDGRATLDWIAAQSWFNGAVGMWGMSYPGYTLWAAASTNPPMLKALAPAITGSYLGPEDGRIFPLDLILNWMLILDSLLDENVNLFEMARRTGNVERQQEILSPGFSHLPLSELDQVVLDKDIPFFKVWQEHPETEDPYWQAVDFSDTVAETTAPVHFVSGWFDIFLPRLLEDYATSKAAGHDPHLTIGPWYHLDFDRFLSVREALTWFDIHLKGKTGLLRPNPIRIHLGGADRWLDLDSWPPETEPQTLYLSRKQDGPGELSAERPNPAAKSDCSIDSYTYDPADPTPNLGGPLLSQSAGSYDNNELETRNDILTYTTPPLEEYLDVIGTVRLTLYASSSLPHSDFFGRLCDVHPDGRSMNISDGLVRLDPQNTDLHPDTPTRIEIELIPTAHRFLKGHRLRLQVSSGSHPRYARNLGTDEPLPTATRMESSTKCVYLNSDYPSSLTLPIRPRDEI